MPFPEAISAEGGLRGFRHGVYDPAARIPKRLAMNIAHRITSRLVPGSHRMRVFMHSIRAIFSFYISLICFKLEHNFKLYAFFFAFFDLDPTVKEVVEHSRTLQQLPFPSSPEEDDLLHPPESRLLAPEPRQACENGMPSADGKSSSHPLTSILEEEPHSGPRDELWETHSDAKESEEEDDAAVGKLAAAAREDGLASSNSGDETSDLGNRELTIDLAFPSPPPADDDADASPIPLTVREFSLYREEYYDQGGATLEQSRLPKPARYANPAVVRQLNFASPKLAGSPTSEDDGAGGAPSDGFGRDSDDDIVPSVGSWEVDERSDTFSDKSERIRRSRHPHQHRWWKFWLFAPSSKSSARVSPARLALASCSDRFLSCSGRMHHSFREEPSKRSKKTSVAAAGNAFFKAQHQLSPRKSFDGETKLARWFHNGSRSFGRQHSGELSFGRSPAGWELEREAEVIRRLVKGVAPGLTVADLLNEHFE